MSQRMDLTGKVFGSLTVLAPGESKSDGDQSWITKLFSRLALHSVSGAGSNGR